MEIATKEDHNRLEKEVKDLKQMLSQLLQLVPDSDGYMTREEVARYFRVKTTTLDKWDQTGLLIKHYPNGDSTKAPRYKRKEVENYYTKKNTKFFKDGLDRNLIRKVS